MVKHFWRAMMGLAVTIVVFLILSYIVLYALHIRLAVPGRISMLTNFSTNFPSIWNIVRPGPKLGWTLSVIMFLLQIALTGGLFGTLVRANTGDSSSVGSFVSDSLRPFFRLLLWNIFWSAVYLLIIWLNGYSTGISLFVAILAAIVRYLFIFAEIALVCEGQDQIKDALSTSVRALMRGFGSMLPYGMAILLLTAVAMTWTAVAPFGLGILAALLYCLILLWLYHMIVARYLFYSNWRTRWGVDA